MSPTGRAYVFKPNESELRWMGEVTFFFGDAPGRQASAGGPDRHIGEALTRAPLEPDPLAGLRTYPGTSANSFRNNSRTCPLPTSLDSSR